MADEPQPTDELEARMAALREPSKDDGRHLSNWLRKSKGDCRRKRAGVSATERQRSQILDKALQA